jgi:hypothetical protein
VSDEERQHDNQSKMTLTVCEAFFDDICSLMPDRSIAIQSGLEVS